MEGIRKAVLEDIPQVAAIYDHILTEEEGGRTTVGWIRGFYPTEQTALEALEAGTLFVLERGGVVAAAAKIDQNQAPAYAGALWQNPNIPQAQVMALHTLVVDPAFAGMGCGTQFVRFYESYALEQGCTCLRMDTNAANTAARQLYARLGYREVGIIPCLFNGIPNMELVCLEKVLHL